jgi:hypothetical protein
MSETQKGALTLEDQRRLVSVFNICKPDKVEIHVDQISLDFESKHRVFPFVTITNSTYRKYNPDPLRSIHYVQCDLVINPIGDAYLDQANEPCFSDPYAFFVITIVKDGKANSRKIESVDMPVWEKSPRPTPMVNTETFNDVLLTTKISEPVPVFVVSQNKKTLNIIKLKSTFLQLVTSTGLPEWVRFAWLGNTSSGDRLPEVIQEIERLNLLTEAITPDAVIAPPASSVHPNETLKKIADNTDLVLIRFGPETGNNHSGLLPVQTITSQHTVQMTDMRKNLVYNYWGHHCIAPVSGRHALKVNQQTITGECLTLGTILTWSFYTDKPEDTFYPNSQHTGQIVYNAVTQEFAVRLMNVDDPNDYGYVTPLYEIITKIQQGHLTLIDVELATPQNTGYRIELNPSVNGEFTDPIAVYPEDQTALPAIVELNTPDKTGSPLYLGHQLSLYPKTIGQVETGTVILNSKFQFGVQTKDRFYTLNELPHVYDNWLSINNLSIQYLEDGDLD